MPFRHDPADSLADIIENAERIEKFLSGIDHAAFAGSGLMRDAVNAAWSGYARLRTGWATAQSS